MKLRHNQALGLMVAVTLMWSIAGVVTRQLEYARSFEVTFWRSFFTVLSLALILPLWRGPRVFARVPWGSGLFWLSALCWCVMFTAFMVALTLTTVANVLLTMAIGPLLTALFSRLFLGHRLASHTWLAIIAAGCGIAYMQSGQLSASAAGDGWGLAVAVCVPIAGAVQWTMMQHVQRASGDSGPVPDMVPCVMLGALLSCLVALPLALPLRASAHDIGLLAMLGLVQLAIPCALSVLCAGVLKSTEMSLLQLLEVIFGIALAWLGANEVPSRATLVGGAVVLLALVGNALLGQRRRA